MAKYEKSYDELKQQLHQQINLLSTSARLYDKGDETQAIHLATSIRVVVYDYSINSISLLTLLECALKTCALFPEPICSTIS